MIGPGGSICHHGIRYKTKDRRYRSRRRLQRSTSHSVTFQHNGARQFPAELAFHFAWDYLDSTDKVALCLSAPVMSCYSSLRLSASQHNRYSIKTILRPLDHNAPGNTIDEDRCSSVATLLLLCDFDVGKLIRLLQGQYTGDFIDFPLVDSVLESLRDIEPSPTQPKHDFSLLHQLYHHGAPVKGQYACNRSDMLDRNIYDNHAAARPHLSSIIPKVSSDIQKSYALALPRWTLRFIDGLFLAALGWVTRLKNGTVKGRQVNDPSAHVVFPSDSGALNDHISVDTDCPDIYYQTCLLRVLIRAYNLRIAHPLDDIIAYKDDLVTAFRRVRYHPDISSAHAFVLANWLIIPIGLVFGARDSPSIFCQISEIRAFASEHFSTLGLPISDQTLIDTVTFTHDPPTPNLICPAQSDSLNQGIPGLRHGPHNTFVDDTIMMELRRLIRQAAIHSVLSAAIFIGSAEFVEAPISTEKFEKYFQHTNELLGFIIDTRRMTLSYPQDKQKDLLSLLNTEIWISKNAFPIKKLASILGKLRNLGQIIPFGVHFSINLQLSISKIIKKEIIIPCTKNDSMRGRLRRIWNPFRKIHISKQAIADITFIRSLLNNAPPAIWSRPISLLIPRDPHFTSLSDACNIALGGFSPILDFQWRLLACTLNAADLHINIKEFLALFINVYFSMIAFSSLRQLNRLPQHLQSLDGWIFHLKTDNTSSISWMLHASRSREPIITRLAQLLSRLIYQFNSVSPTAFRPQHIPGDQNNEADALSRPQIYPTYQSIFNKFPHLQDLRPLRLPSKLISLLKRTMFSPLTEEQSENAMTLLLKADVSSFAPISKHWRSLTLLSHPSPYPTVRASSSPSLSTSPLESISQKKHI